MNVALLIAQATRGVSAAPSALDVTTELLHILAASVPLVVTIVTALAVWYRLRSRVDALEDKLMRFPIFFCSRHNIDMAELRNASDVPLPEEPDRCACMETLRRMAATNSLLLEMREAGRFVHSGSAVRWLFWVFLVFAVFTWIVCVVCFHGLGIVQPGWIVPAAILTMCPATVGIVVASIYYHQRVLGRALTGYERILERTGLTRLVGEADGRSRIVGVERFEAKAKT
jgi:hypothetical protein